MSFNLAQVNVSRLLAPLDSPQLVAFMAALDEVNAAGDVAPGFLWRLQTEDGNATAVKAFGWDIAGSQGVIVNLTTWQSVEALAGFVFSGRHLEIMRQRRQWFHKAAEATTALWWVPSGHRLSTDEAEDRVRQLRRYGPSADSFTFRKPFPAPGLRATPVRSSDDWLCQPDWSASAPLADRLAVLGSTSVEAPLGREVAGGVPGINGRARFDEDGRLRRRRTPAGGALLAARRTAVRVPE